MDPLGEQGTEHSPDSGSATPDSASDELGSHHYNLPTKPARGAAPLPRRPFPAYLRDGVRRLAPPRPPQGAVPHLRWTEALPKRPPSGGTSTNGSVVCPSKALRAPTRSCERGGHRSPHHRRLGPRRVVGQLGRSHLA